MRTILTGLLALPLVAGCGQTLVLELPSAPPNPFEEPLQGPQPLLPRVECEFMTLLIDFSRKGEVEVSARVARAMAEEFESFGTRVTDDPNRAYWSLMILASGNARRDGFVFSALLTARNMNEGYDPGVTVFARRTEPPPQVASTEDDPPTPPEDASPTPPADESPRERELRRRVEKLPTLYNGLSYGPLDQLDEQARTFARQAYAAVFPAAKQLCDFQAADERREQTLDEQLPKPPKPL